MSETLYICRSCQSNPEFGTGADFKKHALKVHGNDLKQPGTKKPLLYLDGSGWYSNLYEWEVQGLKFTQTVKGRK